MREYSNYNKYNHIFIYSNNGNYNYNYWSIVVITMIYTNNYYYHNYDYIICLNDQAGRIQKQSKMTRKNPKTNTQKES